MSKIRKYSTASIHHLAKAIDGYEDSYKWLNANNYKELAAFHDIFINQNETALMWLKKYGFDYLVNVYFSLIENKNAQQLLIKHPARDGF